MLFFSHLDFRNGLKFCVTTIYAVGTLKHSLTSGKKLSGLQQWWNIITTHNQHPHPMGSHYKNVYSVFVTIMTSLSKPETKTLLMMSSREKHWRISTHKCSHKCQGECQGIYTTVFLVHICTDLHIQWQDYYCTMLFHAKRGHMSFGLCGNLVSELVSKFHTRKVGLPTTVVSSCWITNDWV